jgi:hypothetical protein
MAKMAVYDKHTGKDDWKDDVYFRQDYIYSNNMRTRFYVFFGCVILTAFYLLHRAAFHEIDVFSIDYRAEITLVVIFFAAVLVFYTVAGTILYTARYVKMQRRIENYLAMMDELENEPVKDMDSGEKVSEEFNDIGGNADEAAEPQDNENGDDFYDYFRETSWDELEKRMAKANIDVSTSKETDDKGD